MEQLLAHAVGAGSRMAHASMMVEGELMSVRKPMSPWSGQELTSNRLPLPLPDPYGNEPPRPDPTHLTIRTDCPYTAEPNNEQLLQAGLVTPNHLFYIRDHLPAPILSAESYSLTIEGPGVRSEILLQQKQGCRNDVGSSTSSARSSKSTATAVDILHTPSASSITTTSSSSSGTKPGKLVLTLQDLQERFPQHSILATLQCAGNRRNDMRRHKEVKGGPWEAGAIGTALWTGPRLREVLSAAGVDVEGLLVAKRRRQQQQQAQWAEGAARHLIQRQQQGGPQEGVTAFTSQAATAAAAAADLAAEAGAGAAAAGLESAAAAAAAARIQEAPSATDTAAPHTPEAPAEPHLLAPAAAAAADSADAVPDVRHVWFEGYDSAGPDTHFLVSVPVLDALAEDADVLLALQMNMEPLPPYHGYPVRVVVPGHVGVRSVKWLKRIILSAEDAPSHWQQSDYKMLPPHVDSQIKADWGAVPAMQIMPVQSAICIPAAGTVCDVEGVGDSNGSNGTNGSNGSSGSTSDGCIEVQGYAWSGGGVGVIRVEVTADGGGSWTPAELLGMEQLVQGQAVSSSSSSRGGGVAEGLSGRQGYGGKAWAWTHWRARVPVRPGLAKAAAVLKGQTTASGSTVGSGSAQQQQQVEEEEQAGMQAAVEQKQDEQKEAAQQGQEGDGGGPQSHGGSCTGGSEKDTAAAAAAAARGPSAGAAAASGVHQAASDTGSAVAEQQHLRLVRLSVRAVDAHYNSQPRDVGSIWNIRGAGTNSWHSVEVYV